MLRSFACVAALLSAGIAAAPATAQERIGLAAISREKAADGAGTMRIRIAAAIDGPARPQLQGTVTAIPYDRALPTVQLKIKGIGVRKEQNCTSLTLYNWPVELEDIADGAYAAYRGSQQGDLGQLVILYPPRPAAKAMAPESVRPADLPRGNIPSQFYAAFDFDADGRPDLVEMTTCCGVVNKDKTCAPGDSCVKSYRRGGKSWRLINQREEC